MNSARARDCDPVELLDREEGRRTCSPAPAAVAWTKRSPGAVWTAQASPAERRRQCRRAPPRLDEVATVRSEGDRSKSRAPRWSDGKRGGGSRSGSKRTSRRSSTRRRRSTSSASTGVATTTGTVSMACFYPSRRPCVAGRLPRAMRIGVAKEIKSDEYRVALTPAGALELINAATGSQSRRAPATAAHSPIEYLRVGAQITSVDDVWEGSDMVLKVKEPVAAEYRRLREGLILFTYLHIAADEPLTRALLDSGITGVAYETVEVGRALPLLAPMSRGRRPPCPAGRRLFPREAARRSRPAARRGPGRSAGPRRDRRRRCRRLQRRRHRTRARRACDDPRALPRPDALPRGDSLRPGHAAR